MKHVAAKDRGAGAGAAPVDWAVDVVVVVVFLGVNERIPDTNTASSICRSSGVKFALQQTLRRAQAL